MATVLDYLDWHGDVPFSEDPVNEVDSLVFSLLAYAKLGTILPDDGTAVALKEVWEKYARTLLKKKIRLP